MSNRNDIQIELVEDNFQYLHVRAMDSESNSWLLMVVYASLGDNERNETWRNILALSARIIQSWLLVGYSNKIASPGEQKGGAPPDLQKCLQLASWINYCKLVQVSTIGTKFTQRGPKRDTRNRVFKKLDRVMCNVKCRLQYHQGFANVLPRIESGHHPIIVLVNGKPRKHGERPFRFVAAWTTHPNSSNLIHDNWKHTNII